MSERQSPTDTNVPQRRIQLTSATMRISLSNRSRLRRLTIKCALLNSRVLYLFRILGAVPLAPHCPKLWTALSSCSILDS